MHPTRAAVTDRGTTTLAFLSEAVVYLGPAALVLRLLFW